MKTKDKIIAKAIEMYNSLGVTNVSSRDIAAELSISHGNLEYHFKNKETLLMAIYEQMKKEISGIYENKEFISDPFIHFNELLIQLENLHKTYSFFNLDVLEISRNFEKVNELLKHTFQIRKDQMSHFYKRFRDYGYFKKEKQSGTYMRLQHTIRILITFWNSQQEILPYFSSKQHEPMSVYVWELLLPHMTDKGVNAYCAITNTTPEKK